MAKVSLPLENNTLTSEESEALCAESLAVVGQNEPRSEARGAGAEARRSDDRQRHARVSLALAEHRGPSEKPPACCFPGKDPPPHSQPSCGW